MNTVREIFEKTCPFLEETFGDLDFDTSTPLTDAYLRNTYLQRLMRWADRLTRRFPDMAPQFTDLLQFEKAIWDITFLDKDTIYYFEKRVSSFQKGQAILTTGLARLFETPFQINTEEPFFLYESKWDWNNWEKSMKDNLDQEPGHHWYIIKPSIIDEEPIVENLLGIDLMLPYLSLHRRNFTGSGLVKLIGETKITGLESLPSRSNRKKLEEKIYDFLSTHLVYYNSICPS